MRCVELSTVAASCLSFGPAPSRTSSCGLLSVFPKAGASSSTCDWRQPRTAAARRHVAPDVATFFSNPDDLSPYLARTRGNVNCRGLYHNPLAFPREMAVGPLHKELAQAAAVRLYGPSQAKSGSYLKKELRLWPHSKMLHMLAGGLGSIRLE